MSPIHSCTRLTPSNSIDCRFDVYIVTTRDPASRTVSAFNWRHSQGGGDVNEHSSFEREMYDDCFPELPGGMSRFAEALGEQTRCGWLARTCLVSPGEHLCSHLGKGHHYYLIASGLLPILQRDDKHVAVVSHENLDADLDAVLDWLCVPRSQRPRIGHERSSYARSNDTELTERGRMAMESFLGPERYAIESVLLQSEAGATSTVANAGATGASSYAVNSPRYTRSVGETAHLECAQQCATANWQG